MAMASLPDAWEWHAGEAALRLGCEVRELFDSDPLGADESRSVCSLCWQFSLFTVEAEWLGPSPHAPASTRLKGHRVTMPLESGQMIARFYGSTPHAQLIDKVAQMRRDLNHSSPSKAGLRQMRAVTRWCLSSRSCTTGV